MAVGVLMEFPGVTREQYEALGRELALAALPSGALTHLCGPTADGGWRTIDVWESEHALEQFLSEQLIPKAQAVGFPQPSKREVFELYHDLRL
jgi:hypothetical protein